MKQQSVIMALAAVIMCGCQSSNVKVKGRFIGSDAKVAYLEKMQGVQRVVVDSVTLDKEGNFAFNVEDAEPTPSLYNVLYDSERVPLFLAQGDDVTLNSVGRITNNYTVEGSEESALLRDFYQTYIDGLQSLSLIAEKYANPENSVAQREQINREYTEKYQDIKRLQLEFIVKHKANLASVYALYQRLPGDNYLFNMQNDAIYYRTVAEALSESYPESSYVKNLYRDIDILEASNKIIDNMEERSFPDLRLKDMYGEQIALSSLEGKVVLLEFWSAQLSNSNIVNAELKEIYSKYKDQGFEIYQVGIDTSKAAWVTAVQEQKLPWISVSDLLGSSSPTMGLYNVSRLPANFLISRDGEIVARDLIGAPLTNLIEQELNKK